MSRRSDGWPMTEKQQAEYSNLTPLGSFVVFEGVRIAKPGESGTPQAGTWVSLEPWCQPNRTTAGTYVAVREFRLRGGIMQPPKAKSRRRPRSLGAGLPITARPLGRAHCLTQIASASW